MPAISFTEFYDKGISIKEYRYAFIVSTECGLSGIRYRQKVRETNHKAKIVKLYNFMEGLLWQDLHYREIYTMEREHSKP